MIAYYLFHFGGPILFVAILNFLIEAVLLAIVIYLVIWVLGIIGVPIPAKVLQLLWVLVFLVLIASLFSGCASLSPAQKSAYSDLSALAAVISTAAGAPPAK